jgi:hypothetical protein
LDAQKALVEAYEAHMTDASVLLRRLRERLETVEETNDLATKRQVIELLVHGIRIDTDAQRGVSATITYVFSPERVAHISTLQRGCTHR